MRISDLPNRNPLERFRSDRRLDPYYDGMWTNGAQVAWLDHESARGGAEAGALTRGAWRPDEQEPSLARVLESRGRERRARYIETLAVLLMWRTATQEQLESFIGLDLLGWRVARSLHTMWSAGLIDLGASLVAMSDAYPRVARPHRDFDFTKLAERMTLTDWAGVSAGQVLEAGSQNDRHNVLTTELGLRAAELLPVPVVAGELLATVRSLAPDGVTVPASTRRGADLMMVRGDGTRVLIETTATVPRSQDKADRWADVLLEDRDEQLVVVFLHCPRVTATAKAERKVLAQQVRAAGRRTVRHQIGRVEQRMFVADWRDWFPARHEVSDRFMSLSAQRVAGDGWEWVALLDPFDLPGTSSPWARELVEMAPYLYGLPHWMRQPEQSFLEKWAERNCVQEFPAREGLRPGPKSR